MAKTPTDPMAAVQKTLVELRSVLGRTGTNDWTHLTENVWALDTNDEVLLALHGKRLVRWLVERGWPALMAYWQCTEHTWRCDEECSADNAEACSDYWELDELATTMLREAAEKLEAELSQEAPK